MEIINLASSSAGNCYIIKNESASIMIEAGLNSRLISARLAKHGLFLSDISACLVTHSHGDHSRCAKELTERGIIVCASAATIKACEITQNFKTLAEWQQRGVVGKYAVLPFPVDHDCEGALGFIITDGTELLLFINDTRMVKWNLSQWAFDHIMIECNHTAERLIENADTQSVRKAQSHMSLDTCKDVLSNLDLTKTQDIYLMHLSDQNADAPKMKKEIEMLTGVPTFVCGKNGGTNINGIA